MELSDYFTNAAKVFDQCKLQSASCQRYFRIAEQFVVKVTFARAELAKYFEPSLAHLLTESVDRPDLTIDVWDSANGKHKAPFPLWQTNRNVPFSNVLTSDKVRVHCQLSPPFLTAVNYQANSALFWIKDAQELPLYEQCRSFRTIFHWWLAARGLQVIHGAAVGNADGGVLLVGQGGAGKSTSAISCLGSQLRYLGDDHCLVAVEGDDVYAYSLYNCAKFEVNKSAVRFEALEKYAANREQLESEKAMLFLHQWHPEWLINKVRIKALILPKVTGLSHTRMVPVAAQEAQRALIPSTMTELPGSDASNFYGLFQITKLLPCMRMEAGTDLTQIPQAISNVLKQAASEQASPGQSAKSMAAST